MHLSPIEEGFDYLGFRVFPHYKHVRKTTISSLKERLRYFNAILDTGAISVFLRSRPSRGRWSKHAIHYAPLYTQLKAMQSTINSYYGLLSQSNHCQLRKQIYHKNFGELKRYLLPNNGYYNHFTIKKGLHFNKMAPDTLCWPETQDA